MIANQFSELVPAHFSPASRVWIYQSSRVFSAEETTSIQLQANQFVAQWAAHGAKVKGMALVLLNRFVILVADETQTQVSGCSTDSSIHFIQQLQTDFSTDFFNRKEIGLYVGNRIELFSLNAIPEAVEKGIITAETLCFNNLTLSLHEWRNKWIIPVANSWLVQKFPGLLATIG